MIYEFSINICLLIKKLDLIPRKAQILERALYQFLYSPVLDVLVEGYFLLLLNARHIGKLWFICLSCLDKTINTPLVFLLKSNASSHREGHDLSLTTYLI